MLSTEEKNIIEKLIEFHKSHGGTISPDNRSNFCKTYNIKCFIHLDPYIDRAIALGLIKYKFSDRTGWTVLTDKGFNFENFKEFEGQLKTQEEVDRIKNEKLKVDFKNAKRQKRLFLPLSIGTIVISIASLLTAIYLPKYQQASLQNLKSRQDTLEQSLILLEGRTEKARLDTSSAFSDSIPGNLTNESLD